MSRSHWRWAAAAALLMLVALMALLRGRHAEPAKMDNYPDGDLSQPVGTAGPGASSAAQFQPGAAVMTVDPQFEICRNPALAAQGLGGLLGENEAQRAYVERQEQALRLAASNALLRSGDDEARMAGHLLRGDVTGAAQLAQGTSHPQAYGMAWLACRGASRAAAQELVSPPLAPDALPMGLPEPSLLAAACASLSAERWAQLAPDNAAPWLELAAAAQQRGDRAQAIDAIHHAGLARSLNTGWGWLPGMVAGVLPEAAVEGGRMQLMLDLTGQQSSMMDLTGISSVGSYCNAPALADANVHQQCERVAQLLMGQSPNLSERLIGVGLAERLGLPPSQMPVSRREVTAALQSISDDFLGAMAQPQACEALRHINRWLTNASRMGEWQAVKAQQLGRLP